MNDPWYQPRFVTCIGAILLMAAFVALNTWETDKGVFRVYLDEGETLCAAYRGKARGWPQTYAVKYVLDEEATTLLGFPKRKFIDDEFDARPLLINVLIAFFAFASATLVLESTARLVALRPKKVREEPRRRMVSEVRPAREEPAAQPAVRTASGPSATKAAIVGRPNSTKAAIAGTGRPITAKLGAKTPGRPLTSKQNAKPAARPASIKQKSKVEEPKPRPISVKPALATRRQEELKKLMKA